MNNMISSIPVEGCTGCTACMSACPMNCIEMKADEYGFYYPQIIDADKCIKCNKCIKNCPVNKEIKQPEREPEFYAAYTVREEIRSISSSGGIFSIVAEKILLQGGIVYAAVYDVNYSVVHVSIEKLEDLYKAYGAKYAQSCLGDTLKKIRSDLKKGRIVLFVGTPCQVSGLRTFLNQDYKNLYCIDFICHGIPSPLAWEGYMGYLSKKNGNRIYKVNMRSKDTGWSNYNYSLKVQFSDGSYYSVKSKEDLFLRLFVGNYINRECCSACKFKGINRDSDITLADFWGIWDSHPEMDDNRGTSAVIVHTKKGSELFERCRDDIKLMGVLEEDISNYNPSLLYSSIANTRRDEVMRHAVKGEYDWIQVSVFSNSIINRIRNRLRKALNNRT